MAYDINITLIPGLPEDGFRNGVGNYEGVVAHSTDDPGATAENEYKFESRTWQDAFVHFFVDDKEIRQIASTDYIAYGAGHIANQRFVHVELCEFDDYNRAIEAYKRYVWLIAKLLKDKGLNTDLTGGLWGHEEVSNNLGGTTHDDPWPYLASKGISKDQFLSDVRAAYNGDGHQSGSASNASNGDGFERLSGTVTLKTDVNMRSEADFGSSIVKVLPNGSAWQVYGKKNGLYNLGGEHEWITANEKYVHFTGLQTQYDLAGKRVESLVDGLRFYSQPSWNDQDVAGTVDTGLGFTIDEKVQVESGYQYKVHNSRGATYYITASNKYVVVK